MPNLAVTTNKFTRVYLEVDRKAKGHVIGVMKKNLNDITR